METITIHRPVAGVGVDAQGNPNPGTPSTISSDGWAVAPSDADESQEAFGTVPVTGLRLFNRAIVDVRSDDQVTVRGARWKVVGSSAEWVSPFGSDVGGTVIAIARVS